MAYVTVTDVRDRLPLVSAAVRADEQVQGFIDHAEAIVDGYLRAVYRWPLTLPIDPLIPFVALDLACGLVLENVYGEDTPNDVDHPATLKQRSLNILGAVRAGELHLEHVRRTNTPPTASRPGISRSEGEGSAFGVDVGDASGVGE